MLTENGGMPKDVAEQVMEGMRGENEMMWIISNNKGVSGAVNMIFEKNLHELSKGLNEDLYILPSSIHEVLIIPDDGRQDYHELEAMVQSINQAEVAPADRLSDHVYHYDSQNHIFELAERYEERQREAEHDAVDKDSVLGDLKEKKQEIAKKDPAKDAATKATTKKRKFIKSLESSFRLRIR